MTAAWEEKAAKAKKGHRPSLKNWERDGLYHKFTPYAEEVVNSQHPYSVFRVSRDGRASGVSVSLDAVRAGCARGQGVRYSDGVGEGQGQGQERTMIPVVLDAAHTPPAAFHKQYEAKCIPVVIRNVPFGASTSDGNDRGNASTMHVGDESDEEEKKECDGNFAGGNSRSQSRQWPAVHKWTVESLLNDPELSERNFKCGEDDDGYTIRIKLRYFIEYMMHNRDDSPLYIFDATFDEDRVAKRILDEYEVPEYFDEDLLGLVGERRRPPYRWFLVGPCRSGTTVHIDPLGTSAWNTLVVGVKRWVLFPPHVPKSVVKGRKLILRGEDDEAIHYFTTILPRIKRKAAASGGKGEYANFECYEFTQYAGETVFIPKGWWHSVLNITHTVGITQNYCSRRNFDEVWRQTRSGRKKMSCSWLRRLKEQHPDLGRRATELNRFDDFVMWEDDPDEQRRWRKKKADKERKKREKKEKKKKKKEAWGEHRTGDRGKDVSPAGIGYGSCGRESKRTKGGSREVSPSS